MILWVETRLCGLHVASPYVLWKWQMDTIVNSPRPLRPAREHFVLRESSGKVRISTTVTPLGNILQEIAK